MIDLKARARTLNEQSIAPRLPVDVVLAHGRRIHARRLLLTIAIVCSVAGVLVGTAALRSTNSTKHLTVTEPPTHSHTTTPVPPPSFVPPPKTLLVHEEQGGHTTPGRILLLDTATGHVIRRLGADYDPYLANGFAFAHSAGFALWTRLNEPAQTFELVQVPITGGTERVRASVGGINVLPQPPLPGPLLTGIDPTGAKLWQQGNTIVDLRTGDEQPVGDPPIPTGWTWADSSWLPGGHELFIIETKNTPQDCFRTGPPGVTPRTLPPECISTPASRTRNSHGLVYDLDHPPSSWHTAAVPDRTEGWANLQLLGPGRLPSTVVAAGNRGPENGPLRPEILTINVDTGAIIDRLALPTDSNVLAVDASGTNILFDVNRLLERISLADKNAVIMRKQVAEAAW